jgi:hypothetical protein
MQQSLVLAESFWPRGDAARRFRLHPGRIGNLVVLGDVGTVFGDLPPGTECTYGS